MERVHETGIIGSLRWWYEAIVRGLGGDACDPTTTSCIYDSNKANDGLCDVCRLFGATGWRRRFRLQIVAERLKPAWAPEMTLNIRPYGRTRGWYLSAGQVGSFTLALHGDPETRSILMALLRFLEQWGSLGSRNWVMGSIKSKVSASMKRHILGKPKMQEPKLVTPSVPICVPFPSLNCA